MAKHLPGIKRALLIYSMFIVAIMILATYALVWSQRSEAQNLVECSGGRRSGAECNSAGDPDLGNMWGCYANAASRTGFACEQVPTNSNPHNLPGCYLDSDGVWKNCNCSESTCQAACLEAHRNDPSGTWNYTDICGRGDPNGGCGQKFTCSCSKSVNITETPTPSCPRAIDAQFWYYFPSEFGVCSGDNLKKNVCGGLTGWVSGLNVTDANPGRPFYINVNCFQQFGTAPLDSPRVELYRNGVLIGSANDFKLRDIELTAGGTYSAKCIYRPDPDVCFNEDSFILAQTPTTPPVTTPPVTTPPVTTPPVTTPPVTTPPVITTPPVVTTPPVTTPPAPGLQIIKQAINNPGTYGLGQSVMYRIRITNTGQTLITHMTFRDMYNINYLDFIRIINPINGQNVTAAFNVDENLGVISSPDLTAFLGDFWPGRTVNLQFEFVTRRAISTTCNDVFVNPGFGDFQARDCVRISAPLPTTDL